MSGNLLLILLPLLGLVAGALLASLFMRQRQQLALMEMKAAKDAEAAVVATISAGKIAAAEARTICIPQMEQSLCEKEAALDEARKEARLLTTQVATTGTQLAEERKRAAEKLQTLEDARLKLSEAFQAISSEALRQNNQSFLDLAKTALEKFQEGARGDLDKRQQSINELVRPVRESLEKVDLKIGELERARTGAYESLTAQVRTLIDSQNLLRTETSRLSKSLHAPNVRGRWGEIQLRRVVEIAGMVAHCDFFEQQTADEGKFRPDMIVRLPGGKNIVVDAKAPLSAYLEGIDAPDDAIREGKMIAHASQIRAHIDALARKAYWEQFKPAPEFVVLFLPGEMFFSAALERDPSLIEFGADKRVILATPTTLIALLRAVFHGWRQERLARNAREICDLGQELFKRLADVGTHIDRLGRNLNASVDSFNKAVGSLESRVMVTARKFKDLDASQSGIEIEMLTPVDQSARGLQAPELLQGQALLIPLEEPEL